MNKFQNFLNSSNSSIKGVRSEIVSEDAKFAVEEVVRTEETALRELKKKQLSLTDMFPTSAFSTMVTKENFSPKDWAKDLLEVNVEIAIQEVRVKEARKIQQEWFSEIKEKETGKTK